MIVFEKVSGEKCGRHGDMDAEYIVHHVAGAEYVCSKCASLIKSSSGDGIGYMGAR